MLERVVTWATWRYQHTAAGRHTPRGGRTSLTLVRHEIVIPLHLRGDVEHAHARRVDVCTGAMIGRRRSMRTRVLTDAASWAGRSAANEQKYDS
jgi:hypothetical protein